MVNLDFALILPTFLFSPSLPPVSFPLFSPLYSPHFLRPSLTRGEDEFLIALDDTQWLYRVQELLQTAAGVVGKLEEERASVLVSYDSGWDRTTQVINGTQPRTSVVLQCISSPCLLKGTFEMKDTSL